MSNTVERDRSENFNESSVFVNTHQGSVSTSKMGITLVHEHIFNKYHFSKKDVSEAFTLQQIDLLRKHGVKTIVDLTPYSSLGNYENILSSVTDINIVCCIGFYVRKHIRKSYQTADYGQLVDLLSKQVECGKGRLGIRPGIFKVAGWSESPTPLEQRLFRTIGTLQNKYNLPIATHSPKGSLEHLKLLGAAGANLEHVFVSHLDQGLSGNLGKVEKRYEEILRVLDHGAYVLFCEFGETLHSQTTSIAAIRLILRRLKERGYINQLLISADCNWKWKNGRIRLKNSHRGGVPRNYEYVFTQIVPELRELGFSEDDLQRILLDNPRRFFEYRELEEVQVQLSLL